MKRPLLFIVMLMAIATVASASPAHDLCEPTVQCGVWSPCTWLDIDTVASGGKAVYRIAGTDGGSERYSRVHNCNPTDAGTAGCSLYCGGVGGCVDAMTSERACKDTAPPRPSPYTCEIRSAACVTR